MSAGTLCVLICEQSQSDELMQASFAQAEKAVLELLTGLHSNPKTKEDAAKGIIRGPQLAAVELHLRRLKLASLSSSSAVTSHKDVSAKAAPHTLAPDADQEDRSQGLADAILSYYQQLGHMLSCAADLRCPSMLCPAC